jgi:hypothetical protein
MCPSLTGADSFGKSYILLGAHYGVVHNDDE